MNSKKLLKNNKGFSLIELIVVMAVMAVLVLIAAPKYLNYTKDAQATAMQADARVLSDAALQYEIKNDGAWPATGEAFDVAVDNADLAGVLETAYKDAGGTAEDGSDAAVADVVAASGFKALDADALSNYVKRTKNDIDTYFIGTEGKLAGEVFHKDGCHNSSDDYINGLYTVAPVAPVEP